MHALRFVAVLGTLGLLTQPALADGSLSDYFGPREISVGESMRGAASGARAITLNPAGLSLTRQLVFEGSYGFRPEDGASSIAVSACDSTNALPGCYYYRYFTAEPKVGDRTFHRRAHEMGIALSRAIGPNLSLGTTSKYFDYNTDLAGEDDSDGFSLDIGIMFRANPAISLGLVGYNVIADDSSQYPRAVGTGLAIRPVPSLGFSADAVWNFDAPEGESTGRYGGGAEYFFQTGSKISGYPLRAGGIYDTADKSAWLTGGIGYANPKMAIDIGARKKMDGDKELLVLAGLRFFHNQGR